MTIDEKQAIRVAIVGVGNCASSLVQGVFYYREKAAGQEPVPGIMHNVLGGYRIGDIHFVAAFDIDQRKIAKDLSQAIFEKPNCTTSFCREIPAQNVAVKKGPVLDGLAPHMASYPEERRFRVDEKQQPVNVVEELRRTGAHILLNYLPVGSHEAACFYARAALEAGCAFVNCMPVFIASEEKWTRQF
jgi:myo-inositol-1-phosphate synthase